MKKKYLYLSLSALTLALLAVGIGLQTSKTPDKYADLREKIRNHPFTQREPFVAGVRPEGGKRAAPDRAWEQDYLRTMDPALGRPTPEALIPVMESMKVLGGNGINLAPGAPQSPWVERGPNNVGGRTRALTWDPNDGTGKKVWAGGVNGGLWYNNDITSATSSWVNVDDFWDNIAVTCIAFDPVDPSIVYAGTGEGFTANGSSSARGAGIWKSSNGGSSWAQLSATSAFYWVNDIVVRDEGGASGVVYVAVSGQHHAGEWHGLTAQGIHRSTNGGSSFVNVSPTIPGETIKVVAADLEIGANNRLWAGSKTNSYSGTDRGGGRILWSDNGTSWTTSYDYPSSSASRVAIACAPSDSATVYALIEDGNQLAGIVVSTDYGSNWSAVNEPSDADNDIPNTDFTRGQAWYDLVIAVDPANANTVIAGGIDLFRSVNGGSSWTQISKWSNNNNLANLNCSEVHADQHAIVFKPGSSSTALFGNDGGVYYTTSLASAGSADVIQARNKDYNITQFYACAIHPTAGSNVFLAGSQDNGTQRFSTTGMNSTIEVTGGDGAFCFIDQDNPTVAIGSYIYNSYYKSTNTGQTFPVTLIENYSTGKFINVADYHDGDNVLYSGKGQGTLWRIRNITGTPSSPETITVSGMSDDATAITCSPYSSTVFVGSEVGELFAVTDANGSYSVTEITGGSMPAGSVSCIEIGADDDELLVTFFNYGVTSVWYTSDGGSNWSSKEGNLPNMPVRWALFNPNNRDEVILATDLGVWSTHNLFSSSPSWVSSSSGLANTRIDMLQIRASDQLVLAASHGRGVFSSFAFAAQAPVAIFGSSTQSTCVPQPIDFYDSSIHDPTSRQWSFSPSTVSYDNGTTDTSKYPRVRFLASGTYTVTLTVTNSLGSDAETKTSYITVSPALIPTISIQADANPSCQGTTVNFTSSQTDGGTNPIYLWMKNGLSTGQTGANFSTSQLSPGDTIVCYMISNDPCAQPASYKSNSIVIQHHPVTPVTLTLEPDSVCISAAPFVLTGGFPLSGTYSGAGILGAGMFDPAFAGFGPHTITYKYTDGNGCSDSATAVITVGNLPAKPVITRNGNTLTCSEIGDAYEWKLNGVVIPTAINRDHTMLSSGVYEVRAISNFGCSSASDPFDEWMVSITTIPGLSSAMIYPNPGNGQFNLSLHALGSQELQISIVDAQGKQVQERSWRVDQGDNITAFNLDLPSGTYFLLIRAEGGETRLGFVIK